MCHEQWLAELTISFGPWQVIRTTLSIQLTADTGPFVRTWRKILRPNPNHSKGVNVFRLYNLDVITYVKICSIRHMDLEGANKDKGEIISTTLKCIWHM